MSAICPPGQTPDAIRTPFGQCLDAVRTLDPTRPDPKEGEGLQQSASSPSLSPTQEVWLTLRSGVNSLDLNDRGRPWPGPNRSTIARLTAEYPADLCLKAAREAKEIVQSQDRAPNVTALFEKRLRELVGEAERRDEVRSAVRESLGEAS